MKSHQPIKLGGKAELWDNLDIYKAFKLSWVLFL